MEVTTIGGFIDPRFLYRKFFSDDYFIDHSVLLVRTSSLHQELKALNGNYSDI